MGGQDGEATLEVAEVQGRYGETWCQSLLVAIRPRDGIVAPSFPQSPEMPAIRVEPGEGSGAVSARLGSEGEWQTVGSVDPEGHLAVTYEGIELVVTVFIGADTATAPPEALAVRARPAGGPRGWVVPCERPQDE